MVKMTDKELDIIGRAYQSAFDKLVESLNYNGSEDVEHKLQLIEVADIWVNFPRLTKLTKPIRDEETFRLLQMIGKDADLYDDARIMFLKSEKDGLLKLMEIQEELSWKTNMSSFAKQLTKPRFTGVELTTSIMEICLRNLEYIIECINNEESIELTPKEWCEEWRGSYQIEKVTKSQYK